MSPLTITESGMDFGPFADGTCFHIEQSETYKAIQNGVKMAEFVLLGNADQQHPVIRIIEAKSSSPRPGNQSDFDEFIEDVQQKLGNALHLWMAMRLGRHPQTQSQTHELSRTFNSLPLDKMDVRLILVINGHKAEWVNILTYELDKRLKPLIKTWALKPYCVKVYNDEMARNKGLIQ